MQPYIKLNPELPGITGLLANQPWTAAPLSALAQTILRDKPEVLESWFREYIAAEVSKQNETVFCEHSHRAASLALSGESDLESLRVRAAEFPGAESALQLARAVATRLSTGDAEVQVEKCKKHFNDQQIQLIVLIASSFCMFNRYVTGLGTQCSESFEDYVGVGQMLATAGYVRN